MKLRHLAFVMGVVFLSAPAWAQDAAAPLDTTSSACMDSTGPKPANTPCDEPCRDNPTCDGTGVCKGPVSRDNTFCDAPGCPSGGQCFSGICTCGSGSLPDLGHGGTGNGGNGGCSFDGGTGGPLAALSILALLGIGLLGRRRRKA